MCGGAAPAVTNDPNLTGDNPLVKVVWPLLASLAGAITALSFQPWQGMSRPQIGLSVFVGFSFSYFVSPWVVYILFRDGPVQTRVLGMVFYIMATGSNILIPLFIRWIARMTGVSEPGAKS